MNKTINSLSGVEFENLCQQLLQHLGFDTETTKISGDGGIDIVARSSQPFFRGKYIIQCKRYVGSVGEPVIRDLYGVVMSERANKGILITTGSFTPSAVSFAKDKNLELIDGSELQKIMYQNGFNIEDKALTTTSFLDNPNFDVNKYNFYKSLIAQNACTEEIGWTFINFLFGYFANTNPINAPEGSWYNDYTDFYNDMVALSEIDEKNHEIIHSGLTNEFINIFDWFFDKYCKKGKDNKKSIDFSNRKI